MTVAEVMTEIEKDRVFYDESGGGATFSGGEPLYQPEFLAALLAGCRDRNIHTVVDTSGYCPPEYFDAILDQVDLFLYDLKGMDEAWHRTFTGQSNQPVLDNLRKLAAAGQDVHIRIPVIPGVNDNLAECQRMMEFLSGLRTIHVVHLLPFHATAADKYRRLNVCHTFQAEVSAPGRIEEMREIFSTAGMTVIIGG